MIECYSVVKNRKGVLIMAANMSYIQARTSEELKKQAVDILDRLGLNLTTYINMALNQLVIQERIPFEVKLNPFSYTSQEVIREVETTLAMEGMKLDDNDMRMLRVYENGSVSGDELREQIISEAQNG